MPHVTQVMVASALPVRGALLLIWVGFFALFRGISEIVTPSSCATPSTPSLTLVVPMLEPKAVGRDCGAIHL